MDTRGGHGLSLQEPGLCPREDRRSTWTLWFVVQLSLHAMPPQPPCLHCSDTTRAGLPGGWGGVAERGGGSAAPTAAQHWTWAQGPGGSAGRSPLPTGGSGRLCQRCLQGPSLRPAPEEAPARAVRGVIDELRALQFITRPEGSCYGDKLLSFLFCLHTNSFVSTRGERRERPRELWRPRSPRPCLVLRAVLRTEGTGSAQVWAQRLPA